MGIVGDKIILYSDVMNAMADIQRQGGTLPPNADCQILEQALVSKVLMLQAMKDSLVVTDEEVEAELDLRVREFIRIYGSQEAVETLANKTIYQIKDDARESVRENKLAQAMQRKIIDNVRITPNEVKEYFDEIPKDSLPFFESEVEVGQIILYPEASRALEKYAMDELVNYKRQIVAKTISFEQAARLYSDDPGSKERGGRYELNRNDKSWDPDFLSGAFRLKEGEISPIIKTKFGYHLIYMIERSGDNATISHILKIPPVTDEEINAGIALLDSLRGKLVSGAAEFSAVAGKHTDDEMAKFAGPFIISGDGDTYNRIDELDKEIVAMLGNLQVGEYSQPVAFVDPNTGTKGVRMIYLKSRSEPHRMNLRDDYNKISQAALEEKKYITLDKWLTEHIPNYYIMIDHENDSCPQLSRWTAASKTASL